MAASVINATYDAVSSVSNGTVVHTINIPASTIGSNIIVYAVGKYQGTASPVVTDSTVTPVYTEVPSAKSTLTVFGPTQIITAHYRLGVPAGITQVAVTYTLPFNSDFYSAVLVLECTDIDFTTPIQTAGINSANNQNTLSLVGPTLMTGGNADSIFVFAGTMVSSLSGNLFNPVQINGVDESTLPGGGAQLTKFGWKSGLASSTNYQGVAPKGSGFAQHGTSSIILNTNTSILTLNLNDSVSTPDSLVQSDSLVLPTDTVTLMDLVDAVLNSNERFLQLLETIVFSDTLTFMNQFFRGLFDAITLSDSIITSADMVRLLSDEVRIQDWFGIKKTSSSWGS